MKRSYRLIKYQNLLEGEWLNSNNNIIIYMKLPIYLVVFLALFKQVLLHETLLSATLAGMNVSGNTAAILRNSK